MSVVKNYVTVTFKEGGERTFANITDARVVEGVFMITMEPSTDPTVPRSVIYPLPMIGSVETYQIDADQVQ